jgi:acetyltransferase
LNAPAISFSPRTARTSDGHEYCIRAITPADADREREFIQRMSPQSRYQRFMHYLREPSPAFIDSLVNVDQRRTMALVAVIGADATERIIGVARYAVDDNGQDCEFAITVADDWQCRGIGTTLAPLLFEHATRAGFRSIYGLMLANNDRMIELAEWLGLTMEAAVPGQGTVRAVRRLN